MKEFTSHYLQAQMGGAAASANESAECAAQLGVTALRAWRLELLLEHGAVGVFSDCFVKQNSMFYTLNNTAPNQSHSLLFCFLNA